jgi:murein DD-endopeptidase MepM/ murein hydrolase activator NlpD
VVQVVPPGGVQEEGDAASEEKKVRAENKRIRRDLEDLAALEKARKRVQRQLAKAGYDSNLIIGAGGLAWPVNGTVSSPFGPRWGRLHAGIDISAPTGRVIRAAEAGRVSIRGVVSGYGNYTCVQHTKEFQTCYAHQSRFLVDKGDDVDQGQAIGLVGCTGRCFGDHLHFEVYVNNRPTDPMPYL